MLSCKNGSGDGEQGPACYFSGRSKHTCHLRTFFLDSSGVLPLARELVGRGTSVVLAANSVPSINDITQPELQDVLRQAGGLDRTLGRALAEGSLVAVPNGSDLPVIDL